MKPYLDNINAQKNKFLNYIGNDTGLSVVIAIFTILIVLYLNFGLKLNPEFTNIAKNILTFCLIYLTMARMNSITDYLFGADTPIIIKAGLIMLIVYGVNIYFDIIYKTKPEDE